MNCRNCGTEIEQGIKFCPGCGNATGGQATAQDAGARGGQPGGAAKEWLLHINKQNHGPYSTQEVIDFLKSGRIHPATHIWKQGMEGWQQASNIQEFANASPPAQDQATPEQDEPQKKQEPVLDKNVGEKYAKAKSKRERAESRAAAKKQREDSIKGDAAVKALKTREGQVAGWYEKKIVVLLFLIIAFPLGVILLFISRKFSFFGKLFLTLFFGGLFAGAVFFSLNQNLLPGTPLDVDTLPKGISQETFAAIYRGIRDEYVIYMLGDPIKCEPETRPFIGSLDACEWTETFEDDITITIGTYSKNGLVIWKTWKESVE